MHILHPLPDVITIVRAVRVYYDREYEQNNLASL